MEYPYIKNITHEKVQTLTSLVNAEDGQIVSKTLAQNEAVSVTLFAFAKGEEISTHDSTGDAMVTVLEGTGRFTVDGVEHLVHAGEVLVMPAKKPHAVFAPEAFNKCHSINTSLVIHSKQAYRKILESFQAKTLRYACFYSFLIVFNSLLYSTYSCVSTHCSSFSIAGFGLL